jgi:putative redox protein
MYTVNVELKDNKKVDATIREFTVQTDQPLDNGGDNTALSPYEYFLASLATCAGIYIKGFCTRRKIETDMIKLILTADEKSDGTPSKVKIEIKVPDNFPEQYMHSLISVADLCLVKKTILAPPEFEIVTKYF